jgi:hypothetical protein
MILVIAVLIFTGIVLMTIFYSKPHNGNSDD